MLSLIAKATANRLKVLDLMLDNPHCSVSNLVRAQDLMELSEVRVSLEDVQEV